VVILGERVIDLLGRVRRARDRRCEGLGVELVPVYADALAVGDQMRR